jgi:hypothetical protein
MAGDASRSVVGIALWSYEVSARQVYGLSSLTGAASHLPAVSSATSIMGVRPELPSLTRELVGKSTSKGVEHIVAHEITPLAVRAGAGND